MLIRILAQFTGFPLLAEYRELLSMRGDESNNGVSSHIACQRGEHVPPECPFFPREPRRKEDRRPSADAGECAKRLDPRRCLNERSREFSEWIRRHSHLL